MKETIANYVHHENHYTVVKVNNMFHVECRQNGVLTRSIPFLSEQEAILFADSHGTTSKQLLNG